MGAVGPGPAAQARFARVVSADAIFHLRAGAFGLLWTARKHHLRKRQQWRRSSQRPPTKRPAQLNARSWLDQSGSERVARFRAVQVSRTREDAFGVSEFVQCTEPR